MSRALNVIYMDEAGNTGGALLDPEQPVFTLASNNFTEGEATSLLELVAGAAPEAKFSTLKKSWSGQQRILRLISDERLKAERVKVDIVHKRFMLVAKMVDFLAETKAHALGFDLYVRGQNIALSNAIFFIGPTACGKSEFTALLTSFMKMVRLPESALIHTFQSNLRDQIRNCPDQEFRNLLRMLELPDQEIHLNFADSSYLDIDPAVATFVEHCFAWGTALPDGFEIIHDQSKPVSASRDRLEALMAPNIPAAKVGYDRRVLEFPLKGTSLAFADSKLTPQLQIADLIAGAMLTYGASLVTKGKDPFAIGLKEAGIERFQINAIWPTLDITPESLGTDGPNYGNHIDFLTEHLNIRPKIE